MSALAELDRRAVWLNSEPLTAEGLRGQVVAVDFWTYSCVNWLRTLPYVGAWAERYRDRGLVVVGVHAPEFSFEHELDNVRHAVTELGVAHPVVIDNDFAVWRSFQNRYWPAQYLVDADGHGVVDDPRMYQLVRQDGVVAARHFEITFDGAGVRAYVFTFG